MHVKHRKHSVIMTIILKMRMLWKEVKYECHIVLISKR